MIKVNKKRLDQILIDRGLAISPQEANFFIMAKKVHCENKILDKPGQLYPIDINISVKRDKPHQWVSRAGVKLEHGLNHFNIDANGLIAVDIGCAIGGFTEVLLKNNAKKIYAVDVGYGEFDWKLRSDARVILLERTNARYLSLAQIPDMLDLIVCDASFIGLKTILPAAMRLTSPSAKLIALIKPQFEVRKEDVGDKGIVTDPHLHQAVIEDIESWITEQNGWRVTGITASPIKGTKGNKEFLIGATFSG